MRAPLPAGPRHALAGLMLLLTLLQGTAMATEEPGFTTSLQQDAFEVREYPALVAAEVTVGGERDEAASAGFRLLAGYIFGGNTRRESIPMTAPVVQARTGGESIAMTAPVIQTGEAGGWVVRFIMPKKYSLDALPVPNDPKVRLVALPPARFAVVRFSGLARVDEVAAKTAELQAFAATNKLPVIGPPSLARYDPPWTLWFMRHNEVMLPLRIEGAQ